MQHARCCVSSSCCGLQIFNLINLIIERLADGVKPHCEGLLRRLPDLWQQGQTLLRVQVGRAISLLCVPLLLRNQYCPDGKAPLPRAGALLPLCSQ